MSLFNKLLRKAKVAKKITNRAGGEAFLQSPKMQLVSLLLTSFAQDQTYRKAEDVFKELAHLLTKVDPKFAAQAAIFARNEYGMRSITHVLAGELAAYASGKDWAKEFYRQIVRRPDDMLEIAAYYKSKGGTNLPNAMKKGFAQAFDKFNAYQIAKYRGESKAIKLIDIVNMVHPQPTQANAKALQELVDGTLKNTETWESMLTKAGQNASNEIEKQKLKLRAWSELLREEKLGYFALVRNLRNISELNDSKLVNIACRQLVDENRIKKSLVLPFRLIVAWKQLNSNDRHSRKMRNALEDAIDIACNNVPKKCNADIIEFGNLARYINYNLRDSVMDFASKFAGNNQVGHGTDFHSIFKRANKSYDRIVIFSDMQGWVGYTNPTTALNAYKEKTGANPFIYSFDLAGYGSLQFPENKVFGLAGFSEKAFDLISVLETDSNALVNKIAAVEL